jgi:hypothetical protein
MTRAPPATGLCSPRSRSREPKGPRRGSAATWPELAPAWFDDRRSRHERDQQVVPAGAERRTAGGPFVAQPFRPGAQHALNELPPAQASIPDRGSLQDVLVGGTQTVPGNRGGEVRDGVPAPPPAPRIPSRPPNVSVCASGTSPDLQQRGPCRAGQLPPLEPCCHGLEVWRSSCWGARPRTAPCSDRPQAPDRRARAQRAGSARRRRPAKVSAAAPAGSWRG